jgi:energy-coupling factor transporter ATP-binding protein EcfA2
VSFWDAVEQRRNILISGGTSSGKTSLLTVLAAFISEQDRVVLIEDTSKVQMTKPNLVRFEARRQQPGLLAVFAEVEREILRERFRAGLGQARQQGKRLGRPALVAYKASQARKLFREGFNKSQRTQPCRKDTMFLSFLPGFRQCLSWPRSIIHPAIHPFGTGAAAGE